MVTDYDYKLSQSYWNYSQYHQSIRPVSPAAGQHVLVKNPVHMKEAAETWKSLPNGALDFKHVLLLK